MSELLPCPFCGGEDIDEYEGDYGNGVYCMNCGAMMGEQIHRDFYVHERVTYEQAVEAWNTRAERTCHNTEHMDGCFVCSACGEGLEDPRQEPNFVKWCPFCGAKVIDKVVEQ